MQTSSIIYCHSCWLFIAALLQDLEGVQHWLCKHRKWWGGGEDDDMWQRSWTAFRATQARARGVPPTVFRHLNRMKAGWPLMFSNHKSNVLSLLCFKRLLSFFREGHPFHFINYTIYYTLYCYTVQFHKTLVLKSPAFFPHLVPFTSCMYIHHNCI